MSPGVSLNFSVWGEDLIARDLLRFEERSVDAAPAFAAIADDMMDEMKLQFETEGTHAGEAWTPLKDETLARKSAAGLDPHILQATHTLLNALTQAGDANQRLVITSDSLTMGVGEGAWYGKVHQAGYEAGNIPQRRPVAFNEVARRGFMKTLQRFIVTGELNPF